MKMRATLPAQRGSGCGGFVVSIRYEPASEDPKTFITVEDVGSDTDSWLVSMK